VIVSCPKCEKKFRFNSGVLPEGVRLNCTSCAESFIVRPEDRGEEVRRKVPSLLVAHGDGGVCESVEKVFAGWNMDVIKASDGKEVLGILDRRRPGVVLLDVALPGLYGVFLCEKIKSMPELTETKVILVASVYNNTRYRRAPSNLYGADDYVEKDTIGDELAAKVRNFMGDVEEPAAPVASVSGAAGEAAGTAEGEPRQGKHGEEPAGENGPEGVATSDINEKAERLARVIVADMMLYHRKKFDVDIDKVNIFELFKDEIAEGMKYFSKRLPSVSAKEYLIDAFREVLNQKKPSDGKSRGSAAG